MPVWRSASARAAGGIDRERFAAAVEHDEIVAEPVHLAERDACAISARLYVRGRGGRAAARRRAPPAAMMACRYATGNTWLDRRRMAGDAPRTAAAATGRPRRGARAGSCPRRGRRARRARGTAPRHRRAAPARSARPGSPRERRGLVAEIVGDAGRRVEVLGPWPGLDRARRRARHGSAAARQQAIPPRRSRPTPPQ